MSTTTHNPHHHHSASKPSASARVPLQSLGSSTLNARLLTSSFKSILDRTPQLKRAVTLDAGSLPSLKRLCSTGSMLPSPVPTPVSSNSRSPSIARKKDIQVKMLKARLQMAYYKVKNQKTDVPARDLVDSFTETHSQQRAPPIRSFTNPNPAYARTPVPKRAASDLLASSTPIPVSILKSHDRSRRSLNKLVSFKTGDSMKGRPFLPQIGQLAYTSSSPSRFVTSAGLARGNAIKVSTVSQGKRSLKAPEIGNKKKTGAKKSTKLPSLTEITTSMKTSTPLPSKNSQRSLSSGPPKDNFFTPIKASRAKSAGDDSTQLMSSPSRLLTTPSSMGAAKSLLQLAFVKNE